MIDLLEIFSIQQLIARFANSFDLKDWDELARCLSSSLYTDYSDLRGTPPETMSRERFVEMRRSALQDLTTHHVSANVEISLSDNKGEENTGEAQVSMLIYRRSKTGEVFNTHCLYTMGLVREETGWLICSIVQKVFWSDGKPSLHRGTTNM